MYIVKYLPSVQNDLPHLSTKTKKIIQGAIEKKLTTDPVRFGKPLRHNLKGLRRLCVGDYRVIYYIRDSVVAVTNIKHRKDIYE